MRARSGWSLPLVALLATAGCKDDAAEVEDGTVETPYIAIQETLAKDELEGLSKLGAAVLAAAQNRPEEPGMDEVIRGAGKMAARDIATAREGFRIMSRGMIESLEARPEAREGLMVVHCTMTFGGEGAAWVQRTGKVMNPYEGAMMLHCGDKLEWGAPLPD